MEADEPGIYAGQCAEFCGLSHANMRMEVVALDEEGFEEWKANQLEAYAVRPRTNSPSPVRPPSRPTAPAATRSTA